MTPEEYLAFARARYAGEWSQGDATYLEEAGLYGWRASRIAGQERVGEIGCGDGRSTAALLADGHRVVAIDENPECLLRAAKTLDDRWYKVFPR